MLGWWGNFRHSRAALQEKGLEASSHSGSGAPHVEGPHMSVTACKTRPVLSGHDHPSTIQGLAHCTYGQGGVVAGSTANHDEPSTPSNLLQVGLQAAQEHCRGHGRHQHGCHYPGARRGPRSGPGITCAGLKVHPASHGIKH